MIYILTLLATLFGILLGWVHFSTLSRVTDLLVTGRLIGVGLQMGRLAVLSGFLIGCALVGSGPLLGAAAGIGIGRIVALRRTR